MGGSLPNNKKNRESVVIASKGIELDVNADKTKYMIMSRDENAGRSHDIKIGSSSFERAEEFRYLGTNLKDEYSIKEDNNSRLKAESFASSMLYQNKKIKSYRTTILLFFFVWV